MPSATAIASNTQLRADFAARVVVPPAAHVWLASPAEGVERMPLERVGGGGGRATSLVRFAPGASFPPHVHGGGEEFLVLHGEFVDESGRYPAGTYVRNPPGSAHAPGSPEGCLLFVKLHQFGGGDDRRVVVDTHSAPWRDGLVDGLTVLPLHAHGTEQVALERWAPGTMFRPHMHFGGEEIFVLSGVFADEHGSYPAGTWLRNPHGSRHHPSSPDGCTIYVKTGHLAFRI